MTFLGTNHETSFSGCLLLFSNILKKVEIYYKKVLHQVDFMNIYVKSLRNINSEISLFKHLGYKRELLPGGIIMNVEKFGSLAYPPALSIASLKA